MSSSNPARNYGAGARKGVGELIKVNEFRDIDPTDPPRPGDWIQLATRAHLIIDVKQSATHPDTVRYTAVIRDLSDIPAGLAGVNDPRMARSRLYDDTVPLVRQ